MGDTEMNDSKTAATSAQATALPEKPATKVVPQKTKKEKKAKVPVEPVPHVTGRATQLEVGASGVQFSVKAKKGKVEEFNLKGFESGLIPAALAMIAAAVTNGAKIRVEYSTAAEGGRSVTRLRVQS
jgi:hypothetical protein